MKQYQPNNSQKRSNRLISSFNSLPSSSSLRKAKAAGVKRTTRFLIPSNNDHPSATNRLLTPIARGPNTKLSSNYGILS